MSILNVNVGVLGHVDSGKTSLSKALSSVASTAAFDKNPQSQERGITLDLGFSAFYTEAPEQIKPQYDSVQFTLVDCPGHASLIRTIIGGAQIIDMMILVIDVTKGIQTQTSECIIIGEILAKKLLVVLNKIDLIPEKERAQKIDRTKKALVSKVFANTRFPNPMIIPVCALQDESLKELIDAFKANVEIPDNTEHNQLPFLFAVDHCFAIKGKGTVLTGTVLQGTITLEQTVDIPSLNEQKKIKSIQMFKKPVKSASSGDRIGALVTQLEPSRFERGFVAEPNFVKTIDCLICSFEPIRYYKRAINTKSKLHITVGHSTVMGVLHFFKGNWPGTEFEYLDSVEEQKDVLVRIDLETSVACYPNAKLIASKLDTDIHANVCRLAFYGTVLEMCNKNTLALKVYKNKEKNAQVDRIADEYNLIGKNLVKKDGTLNPYIGKKVIVLMDEKQVSNGTIVSSFGSSGKFKVRLEVPLPTDDTKVLSLKLLYKVNSWDKTSAWVQ